MITPEDILRFLREKARIHGKCALIPGFFLCFNSLTTPPLAENYAIPEEVFPHVWKNHLRDMKERFALSGKIPRCIFIEELAPELPEILREEGFEEETALQGMICSLHTFYPAPVPEEFEVKKLFPSSTNEDLLSFLALEKKGFSHSFPKGEEKELGGWQHFRLLLEKDPAHLGLLEHIPVSAALRTLPAEGITEIMGLTSQTKGLDAALLTQIMTACFALGIHTCYMAAENTAKARLCYNLGFAPLFTILSYRARGNSAKNFT